MSAFGLIWKLLSTVFFAIQLKEKLKSQFQFLVENLSKKEHKLPFNAGYTQLHVTDIGQVTEEQEVTEERTIRCRDIFKGLNRRGEPIRTVLMKGVAGVGKTVLTQKFSLDWADHRANQNIDFLFHFTFRELNKFRGEECSLVELLHHGFSQTRELVRCLRDQVLFIFDGLDECRLPLDFGRIRVLTDPTERASVEELLVNLIRGDLLPSARLWITTRPAAANQIPAWCVSMVTEVRGFTDPQKDKYFMKRFRDEQQATAVISHIKSIRSLYVMSRLPIFCSILFDVLETREAGDLPHALTQMYVHFLVVQAKVKNIKYHGGSGEDLHWTPETREMMRSLGKLAFEQLLKENLMFTESDLGECDLDAAAASVHSGVFTQVFMEEPGQGIERVYYFLHPSVQEFLAALHVHQMFFSSGKNLLSPPHSSDPGENLLSPPRSSESPDAEYEPKAKRIKLQSESQRKPTPEEAFYRSAVDQALLSPNLDLFPRFLLGLSLPTNQRLLPGQLTQTGSDQTNEWITRYIYKKLNDEGVSAERSLTLFHCLNELNDNIMLEMTMDSVRNGSFPSIIKSLAQWSSLCFLLLSSDLEEFDLRKYHPTKEGLLGLLPVVKASTKAILSGCGLSCQSCAPLASVLSSSSLTQLDLSNNDLQDSGVELLCEGLKSAHCRLETLRLSGCLISERGGACLAATLSPAPSCLSHALSRLSPALSCLRELDLSYNHPGSSAGLLTALLSPHGPLQTLRLEPAGHRWMVPGPRKYSCEFSLDPDTAHTRLLLSEDLRSVTRVEKEQQYPPHEDRFTDCTQVLSSTGLRGRCYWEVTWSVQDGVVIAASYRSIERRGESQESAFGENDQSWGLWVRDGNYAACHNKCTVYTPTPHSLVRVIAPAVENDASSGTFSIFKHRRIDSSGRVGVFLDWEGGALSFYEVKADGEPFHLYTFVTAFTEPLFPGFRLDHEGSSVTLQNLSTY